jgi:ATP-dependent Clp protease ATP-binding subunit ClpA
LAKTQQQLRVSSASDDPITANVSLWLRWAPLQDQYVSVEELVMAMADDSRFGEQLFREAGLTAKQLEEVIQEIRGGKT